MIYISLDIDGLIEYNDRLAEQPIGDDELSKDAEMIEDNGPKGAVLREYRTCGDDSCRCMSGGEQHGPYNYRIYHDGETVRKEYLNKADA